MEELPETYMYTYPKHTFILIGYGSILGCGAYAMHSILVTYFKKGLGMQESWALMVFHTYMTIKTIIPLLGAILADSFFGKFMTIFVGQFLNSMGYCILFLTTYIAIPLAPITLMYIYLSFMAFGAGISLPCLAALGGDQFKLPEQDDHMSKYYKMYYWGLNVGSLIGIFVAPIMKDIKCLGKPSCYPLTFGFAFGLVALAFLLFLIGTPFYVIKKPKENMVVVISKCIWHAISRKIKTKERKDHWLDHASDKFDEQLIADIKTALELCAVFITMPIFWCLFDQQSSDWALLSTYLNGDMGLFIIPPEQIQILNPVLVVIFIPLFESVIYPLFDKMHFCTTPVKKMVLGFFISGISFVVSGTIYFIIYKDIPAPPPTEGFIEIRAYNPEAVPAEIVIKGIDNFANISLQPFDSRIFLNIKVDGPSKEVYFNDKKVMLNDSTSYCLVSFIKDIEVFPETIKKFDQFVRVRTIVASNSEVVYKDQKKGNTYKVTAKNLADDFMVLDPGTYKLMEGDQVISEDELLFKTGAIYVVLVDPQLKKFKKILLVKENVYSLFWLIPQYTIITMAEILVSITILEFSYSHAPVSMKSFIQALNLISMGLGNFLMVVVTAFDTPHRGYNAIIYTVLMYLDMFLLMFVDWRYEYKAAET